MPSDRSSASAITGEKADREKATSISLQTCCRPLRITARVTGSTVDGRGSCMADLHREGQRHVYDEIADGVGARGRTGLDDRCGVELLDHGGAGDDGVTGQALAAVDRRRHPGPVEITLALADARAAECRRPVPFRSE